ncbi:MAG: flagellar brake protein [Burkholderiales bacterium]|nr:MAG: flagellar brake protein [Burkholderiales bacterium]
MPNSPTEHQTAAALPATAPSEELRVASAAEIAGYLQELNREQTRVTLCSPGGGTLPGRICALNAEADLLGLEIGADPLGLAPELVAGGEITAVAFLGSIKLQFDLESPLLVSGGQGTVLRSGFPQRVYRFQRRQAFRVQPAGSVYPRVVVPGGGSPELTLRVLDLSIGGVALILPAEAAGQPTLPIGQVTAGLVLELDRMTALRIALLPLHASPVGDGAGTAQLGCAFVDLDHAAARSLQVYVDQTEKRRRLLKLDL